MDVANRSQKVITNDGTKIQTQESQLGRNNKKSILEQAGEQIMETAPDVDDFVIDMTGQKEELPFTITESPLDIILEHLFPKLQESGEEYILVSTNPYKHTSKYQGSLHGKQFLTENADVLEKFIRHCFNATCSLIRSEVTEDLNSESGVSELQSKVQVENNEIDNCLQAKNHLNYTNDSNTCSNYYENDTTDNEDVDRTVQQNIESMHQNVVDNKDITETGGLQLSGASTEGKEYPHPKKRLRIARIGDAHKRDSINSEDNSVTETIMEVRVSKSATKRRVAMVKKQFSCQNCGSSFKNLSVLGRHKKKCIYLPVDPRQEQKGDKNQCTEGSDEEEGCDQCNISFKSETELQDHMETHSQSQAIVCLQCDDIFHDENTYEDHIQSHKEPEHKCDECEKSYRYKSALTKHKRAHKKTFQCNYCNSNFSSKERYDSHDCRMDVSSDKQNLQQTTSFIDSKHVCDICQKEFPKRRGLLTHRKLHTDQHGNNHMCEMCSKGFKSRSSLMKHIKFVHSESRDFVCDVCGKSFKQQDTLSSHLKTHDENRSGFKCPECGKGLATSGSLRIHLRTHQDVRPFMCDVCGMSFHQKGNLAKHMLSHTNKTNHNCEKCGKEFKYADTLKTHLRAHALKDGLNDYELSAYGKHYTCEVCGKKMASASQYKVHMRTHTNERPYECTICRKGFKEGGKLNRHMRTHEPPEHIEHNYINNVKTEGKSGFTEIATRHHFSRPSQKLMPHKEQSVENIVPVISTEVTLLHNNSEITCSNADYLDSVDYTGHTDGGLIMVKPTSYENSSSGNEVRVIDENRHQFLMHQLTPVSNLMVEAQRQIQVRSGSGASDDQIVGFVDENQVAPSVYSEVLVQSDYQSNQTSTLQTFNAKYL